MILIINVSVIYRTLLIVYLYRRFGISQIFSQHPDISVLFCPVFRHTESMNTEQQYALLDLLKYALSRM